MVVTLTPSCAFPEGRFPVILYWHIQQYTCSLQARSLSLQGWGLTDLPPRVAFSPAHPLARRDVPVTLAKASIFYAFLGGSGQGCPLLRASNEHILIVRVLRARRAPGRSLLLSLKGRRGVCYTSLALNDRTAQQFLHSSPWNEKPKLMC